MFSFVFSSFLTGRLVAAFDSTYLLQTICQHIDEAGHVSLVGAPWSATEKGVAAQELTEDFDIARAKKATDMSLGLEKKCCIVLR